MNRVPNINDKASDEEKILSVAEGLTIYWFTPSGSRCNYFKYSLLTFAREQKIKIVQMPVESARDFGWGDLSVLIKKEERTEALACLIVETSNKRMRIVLDASDSCFSLSTLIVSADIYFHNAFNSDFMIGRQWIQPYPWQKRAELSHYRRHAQEVIQALGDHFCKLRKFVPMPMVMGGQDGDYLSWQQRYLELLSLRRGALKYEIVVYDSLWAWPQHRLKLHLALNRLSGSRSIYSKLELPDKNQKLISWDVLSEKDKADLYKQYGELPTARVLNDPYEKALASSRLNVFACGKHWGWRQVMMVSLLCGTPILMDRPIYEPYFDFSEFKLFFTANEWEDLADILSGVTDEVWGKIRTHNQAVFDRRLSPTAVARYILTNLGSVLDNEAPISKDRVAVIPRHEAIRIDYQKDTLNGEYTRFQTYYELALASLSSPSETVEFRRNEMRQPSALAKRLANWSSLLTAQGNTSLAYIARQVCERLPRRAFARGYDNHVGQYCLSRGKWRYIFAIDMHDGPDILSESICRNVDVYFKANYWPGRSYPSNVKPIVRGSHYLPYNLDYARNLRSGPKDVDLVFVFKLWAGREHMVRLFEQLVKVPVKSTLRAIVVKDEKTNEVRPEDIPYIERLNRLGVQCDAMGLDQREFWNLCARARLVFARLGKQLSTPNTIAELLSMGTAIALDQEPCAQWPIPLQNGVNYHCCNLRRPYDTSPAPDEDYEKIPGLVVDWLEHEDRLAGMRMNNEKYFDEWASPNAVGHYIVKTVIGTLLQQASDARETMAKVKG